MGINTVRMFAGFFGALLVGGCGVRAVTRKTPIFIGPESDHWLCLSVTHSLTDCCLVDLMAVSVTKCSMMSQQLSTESCEKLS